jgi:hypothetical protein
LLAAGSFIQSVRASDVVIRPREYAKALKNPCKGLRYNGGEANVSPNNPLISLSHDYIRWNTIENSESDGMDKIRDFCNTAWKDLPSKNVKAIPRVYLDWPKRGAYWPADMTAGDYSSARFKSRLVRLIRRLGQLWDGDPRVAFVEMGLIGQWGEQHDPSPDEAMQKLLADTYLAAFKHKLVMRRYANHFTVRNTRSSPMYYNWPVELSLLDPASKKPVFAAVFANVDLRTWLPGTNWQYNAGNPSVAGAGYQTPAVPNTVRGTFTLPPSVHTGEYIVALAVLDPAGMKPGLRFSIVNYFNGGRHPLGLIGVGRDVANPVLNAASFDDPAQDNSLGYDGKAASFTADRK